MSNDILRRYSNLPSLVYMLSKKRITLLDPQSWDDSNDSYYLSHYRERKRLKSVLALCFTQREESYHYWRVFADSSSGVCIYFERDPFLRILKEHNGIRFASVTYLTLKELKSHKPNLDDLPFVKRYAFRDEGEFRVIYDGKTKKLSTLHVPISLSCISQIVLSPWLHPSLGSSVKLLLNGIDGCGKLEVRRSSLINNDEWKYLGASAS